jgi:BON domain
MKKITTSNWQHKTIGFIALVPLVLTACNQQPTRSTLPTSDSPVVTTAPDNSTSANNNTTPNGGRVLSVDDAAEKVGDALDKDPTLRVFDIDAEDEGNAIVLTGRVQNASQKQLAQTLSQQLAPGISIVNRIEF